MIFGNLYTAVSHLNSTDCKAMNVLFQTLDHDKYWFEYKEDFDDPFSGAHVYNLPCASIGYKTESHFEIILRLKNRIHADILHRKLIKTKQLINQIEQEQS